MNSVPATAAIPVILVLLTALLALSLGAIVRAEPWVPAPAEPEPARQFSQLSQPEHAGDPPTAPLPRRIAGESGRVAGESGRIARGADEATFLPGVIGRAGVSGGPPWGPAPKPPGLP